MMKRYILLYSVLLFSLHATAQLNRTAHNIGFVGIADTVQHNGRKVIYNASGGQVVAPGAYYEIVPDQLSVIAGMPYDIGYFPLVFDRDLFVSKGYFSNYVQLEWNIVALGSRIKKFRIFRKPLGQEGDSLLVAVLGPDVYSWQDPYADKGMLYKYTLFAEGLADDLKLPFINTMEGTGFTVATGTVSGRITYEGGTAVEGVNVLAETAGTLSGRSVYLNGSDAYLSIPHNANDAELELSRGFTFQMWMRYEGDQKGGIFKKGDAYEISYEPGLLEFRAGNATLSLPFEHPADSFFHVTAVYDPGNTLRLYAQVTEARVDSATVAAGSTPPASFENMEIGRNAAGEYFQGHIDEMRLWSKPLAFKEIFRDFARYISGTENHIAGYWRLNAGSGDRFYDLSRKGFTFYENHGYIWRGEWSSETPYQSQLAFRGVTDHKGNYIVSGFPYETTGSLYTFTPVFGIHQFEPTQQLRFVGDGASIHNGVDFKDVSSFKVTGTVKYQNTKFPVEGVSILIDGRPAVNSEGVLILTDNQGRFTVDVPIGQHSVRVTKNQHEFMNEGRFPEPAGGEEIATFDFQAPLSGLEFIDKTLVKLAGRVTGGAVQAEKALGFGLSKNNLGNASLFLTSEKGFDLTENDRVDEYDEPHMESSASFVTRNVTVSADPETGEYVAYLPPEKYTITGITAGEYTFGENFHVTVDLQNTSWETQQKEDTLAMSVKGISSPLYPPYSESNYDSVYTVQRPDTLITIGVSSFRFQKRQDFIYRTTPTILVTNAKGEGVFGDETYTYKNSISGTEVEIPLIENGMYTFAHPVFTQRNGYQLTIEVFEQYENQDLDFVDKVPVIDGNLEIVNDIALDNSKKVLPIDSRGRAVYTFLGGYPETNQDPVVPANSFTRVMSITAFSGANGAIKTIWRESNPFRAYIFGGMPTGNNFVTTGPTQVDMILRDPPGSNSFASVSEGTSFSKKVEYSDVATSSLGIERKFSLGGKIETFAGVGAGKITEVEVKNELSLGLKSETTYTSNNTSTNTVSLTQTWSTSSSPLFVGANGDVFVGHSTNIVYGKSFFIEILSEDECTTCSEQEREGFRIGLSTGIRVNPEYATSFIFTQEYIRSFLIPNLKELRNANLAYLADPSSANPTDGPVYLSRVPLSDSRFGTPNTDEVVWGSSKSIYPSNGPSYTVVFPDGYTGTRSDTVFYYNKQIADWEFWLAENERLKTKAKLKENISFDAGAGYVQSVEISREEATVHSFEWSLAGSIANELGFSVDDNGMSESINFTSTEKGTSTTGETSTETTTFSFTLADDNDTNYYSIDVKDGKDGFGPIFHTKGGVTSCPYEGEVRTRYYQPGRHILSEATFRAEVPEITADKAVVANVPDNRPAELVLSLKNNSEASYNTWYRLTMDDSSNPFGAVLEIDGEPLTDGRMFLVNAGTTLQKSLKVYKGQSAQMNYENLQLVLHSTCQYDPTDGWPDVADTVQFSVFFQPGCSDISLTAPKDQWVMNTNVQPAGILPVEISDYDLNYSFFKKVLFQYKAASSSTWITNMVFYNPNSVSEEDFARADQPKAWIAGAKINYSWDMNSLPDRDYDIRAVTICELGPGSEVQTPTQILSDSENKKHL